MCLTPTLGDLFQALHSLLPPEAEGRVRIDLVCCSIQVLSMDAECTIPFSSFSDGGLPEPESTIG